jgi:hypothetical protein
MQPMRTLQALVAHAIGEDMKSTKSESGDGDLAKPLLAASKRQFDGHAVDWDLYRFFVAATEAGSLSGAAARLRVSLVPGDASRSRINAT